MDSALLSDARHAAKLQRSASTVWIGTNHDVPIPSQPMPLREGGAVKVALIARTVAQGLVVRHDGQWVVWTEQQVRSHLAHGWKLVVTL